MGVLGGPPFDSQCPSPPGMSREAWGHPRNSRPGGGHPCPGPGESSPLASCRQAGTLGLAVCPGHLGSSFCLRLYPALHSHAPTVPAAEALFCLKDSKCVSHAGELCLPCTLTGGHRGEATHGHSGPEQGTGHWAGRVPGGQGPWGTMGRASSGFSTDLHLRGHSGQRREGQTPGRGGPGGDLWEADGVLVKDLAAAGWVQSRRRQERPQPPGLESAQQGASPGGAPSLVCRWEVTEAQERGFQEAREPGGQQPRSTGGKVQSRGARARGRSCPELPGELPGGIPLRPPPGRPCNTPTPPLRGSLQVVQLCRPLQGSAQPWRPGPPRPPRGDASIP